jgi:putative oxidoreductase
MVSGPESRLPRNQSPPRFAAMKFLHFNFVPRSTDLALLILRLWSGALMIGLHGWRKVTNFSTIAEKFADPLGIGSTASLALVVFSEVICAALIMAGVFTRAAALVLAINMAMAFSIGHGRKLVGTGNGELPFLFLGIFVALFFSGAGKFSVDAKIGAKS